MLYPHTTGWGRRAAWLLVSLIALLAAGRPICWCSLGGAGHCGGSEARSQVADHERSCCASERSGTGEKAVRDGLAPAHDCCCLDGEAPVAPTPEARVEHTHPLLALPTAGPAAPLAEPAPARPGEAADRAPGRSSPPLFLVNCNFRC